MISQFIRALRNLQLEPTGEDVADILWLALHIGPTPNASDVSVQPTPPGGSNKPVLRDRSSTASPIQESNASERKGKLYPGDRTGVDESEITGMLPFRAPATSALPGTLALGRALRPLMRKVASHTRFVIDEAQTAQRIAEEGLWLPVMNPAQERWLEVALVVDESRSMAIWWHTIAELQLLLEHHGAFRDVRLWGLITDEDGQNARLRMGIGHSTQGQPIHTPSELIDPSGRRLILVISDCVKQAWYNGTIVDVLTEWGKRNPVALMQVLPRELWTMSALGNADAAHLRASVPGQANMQLAYYLVNDWMNREEIRSWFRLPTVTLEPGPLTDWALALTSAEDAWVRGYVLDTQVGGIDAFENENEDGQEVPLGAEERLKRFLATASLAARKLAGLLAATPITLPIVRLIQQTMLPKSQLSHVAEVFLGGLLEQLPGQRATDADEIQYDFIPGIRELLLDSQPTNESAQVLRNVSAFVEDRLGQFLDFRALLADPGAPSSIHDLSGDTIRHIQPFALVGAKVLRRLGGRYAEAADQLERQVDASLIATSPSVNKEDRPSDVDLTLDVSSSPQQTSSPNEAEQAINSFQLPTNLQYELAQISGIVRDLTHQQVPDSSAAGTSIVDLKGMVLNHVQVQLIFWGSAWAGNVSPSANAVFNAAQTILSGPYMSKLSQYRGIESGTMLGKLVIDPSNPPNPFSTNDVAQCVLRLISAGKVPKPEDNQQILYCVFLPVRVNFNQPNVNGEHSFIYNISYSFPLDIDLDKVLFAWVRNDGTLDSITTIFSHALVEVCTNPDGNGFQFTPLDPNNWHEIGDICEVHTDTLNGVRVQAYWSQSDGGCFLPEEAGKLLRPSPHDYRVVWIHGIGPTVPGYSRSWDQVYNQSLKFPTFDNYIEVLWADVYSSMTNANNLATNTFAPTLTALEQSAVAKIRQDLTTKLQSRVSTDTHTRDAPLEVESLEDESDTPLEVESGIRIHSSDQTEQALHPDLVSNLESYVGGFVKYLVNQDIRNAVKEKIKMQLRLLANSAYNCSIIAHSWGTVVAYESLLDLETEEPAFQLAHLFTLGSPLWLVQSLLKDTSGRKPSNVVNWVNVHAQADPIGAGLTPGFQVDADFLVPTYDNANPHGSYFEPGNVAVQRDIIAATIIGTPQRETPTHSTELKLTVQNRRKLVDLLLACDTMSRKQSRNVVVQELPDAVKRSTLRDFQNDRLDIRSIVDACLNYTGGLETLIDIIKDYEGDSLPIQQLEEYMKQFS